MGNCASNPKTFEGDAPESEPVREKVMMSKIEPEEENGEAKNVEGTPKNLNEKSLATLLDENIEEAHKPKTEDVVAMKKEEQPKTEDVMVEKKEEQPKTEEPKEENAEKAKESEKPQETTQNSMQN